MRPLSTFGAVKLEDNIIWVTGASSGIGEHVARQLATGGSRLIISARREEKLIGMQKEFGEENVKVLPFDLLQTEGLDAVAERARALFGRVDVLVLNGGISQRSEVRETQIEVDRKVMEINYFANVILAKAILPSMIQNGYGHFMVTSSLSGKFGFKLRSAYSASKHALHGFFESLRFEEAENGIGVTMICPGLIKTDLALSAVKGNGDLETELDSGQEKRMLPEDCAKQMIQALKAGKHEAVIGGFERNSVWIKRYFPMLHYKLLSKKDGQGQ